MAELTDEQWERVKPHLPPERRSRKGGRPRADDRACLEGVLWVLRSGARWKDLPKDQGFPSPPTCWRRLGRWERAGWAERRRLLGQTWVLPTRAGLRLAGLEFDPWTPALDRLAHHHAVAVAA